MKRKKPKILAFPAFACGGGLTGSKPRQAKRGGKPAAALPEAQDADPVEQVAAQLRALSACDRSGWPRC